MINHLIHQKPHFFLNLQIIFILNKIGTNLILNISSFQDVFNLKYKIYYNKIYNPKLKFSLQPSILHSENRGSRRYKWHIQRASKYFSAYPFTKTVKFLPFHMCILNVNYVYENLIQIVSPQIRIQYKISISIANPRLTFTHFQTLQSVLQSGGRDLECFLLHYRRSSVLNWLRFNRGNSLFTYRYTCNHLRLEKWKSFLDDNLIHRPDKNFVSLRVMSY